MQNKILWYAYSIINHSIEIFPTVYLIISFIYDTTAIYFHIIVVIKNW